MTNPVYLLRRSERTPPGLRVGRGPSRFTNSRWPVPADREVCAPIELEQAYLITWSLRGNNGVTSPMRCPGNQAAPIGFRRIYRV